MMTTDLVLKTASGEVTLQTGMVRIAGMTRAPA